MANRFWVGGTGTWDASTTTPWAATSGGAGGQTVPGSSDAVTFDTSSGGGTVTVNTTVTVQSITAGAFTGTLDFATNNNNVTVSSTAGIVWAGTGTRTINMGSGTWTFTATSGTPYDCSTTTNLTASFASANLVFNAASTSRTFEGGAKTYGSLTVSNNSTKGYFQILAVNTFGSMTVGNGNVIYFPGGSTTTISGALTMTGTSSLPCGFQGNNPPANIATVSVGSASTVDWAYVAAITKAGAGSITATNSLDISRNTGVTITAPSGGGVVGVIGG
jgi:hypothetical protein